MLADSLVQHDSGSEVGGSKWLKVLASGQKWFAECLSSRGRSYPAGIVSADVGWLPVRHHLGSEVGGSKWLKVAGSGQKWFAECLSSRGSSYAAEIGSAYVG